MSVPALSDDVCNGESFGQLCKSFAKAREVQKKSDKFDALFHPAFRKKYAEEVSGSSLPIPSFRLP